MVVQDTRPTSLISQADNMQDSKNMGAASYLYAT